jgi:hypothetical protein
LMTCVICMHMGLPAEVITRTFHESQNKSIYLVSKTRNIDGHKNDDSISNS